MKTITYSILSNGHLIQGIFPIGSSISTQWGMRKVIAHHREMIDTAPDCPMGC